MLNNESRHDILAYQGKARPGQQQTYSFSLTLHCAYTLYFAQEELHNASIRSLGQSQQTCSFMRWALAQVVS
jgi:hypothetical protein